MIDLREIGLPCPECRRRIVTNSAECLLALDNEIVRLHFDCPDCGPQFLTSIIGVHTVLISMLNEVEIPFHPGTWTSEDLEFIGEGLR